MGLLWGAAVLPAPVRPQEASRQQAVQGGRQADGGLLRDLLQRLEGDDGLPGHGTEGYYTVLDEAGRVITRTSLAIGVGDQYIDEDNRLYEIVSLDGWMARAAFREVVTLPEVPRGASRPDAARVQAAPGRRDRDRPQVVIYHSHNAESYVPTSGEAFKDGPGDIHQVGKALKEALEEQGVTAEWSQALHLPHDGGAYRRSRATVRRFLSKGPASMIDVHRDAIPAEEYRTEVNGQPMTKVRIVVGRQNQNREANLQYAKEMKAIADRDFPGLIKGIFHARGNYNQDVGPRMILLEFGTHETSLEDAQDSARLMAQVISQALGVQAGQRVGASGWRTAIVLIALAVVGVLGYLRINAGSWEAFWRRLRQLLRLERVGGH